MTDPHRYTLDFHQDTPMTIVQSAPDPFGVWRDDASVYRRQF
ncbi:hypothetical protein [Lentzea guizhouensis]|nr:hypothetical protein [Lentzea guizhouensis]